MSNIGKDSPEVVKFMALFARLKDWCDEAPEELSDFAKTDTSIKDLCTQLSSAAHILRTNERRHQALFAEPVDPAFLAAWRDYEERYESVLSGIWLADLSQLLGLDEPSRSPKAVSAWVSADNEADEQAHGIEEAIEFAHFNAVDELRWDESQEDFIQRIINGVDAWDGLKQNTGFDLRGVFRRRALVPFVLVPRKVAAKHGSAESLSMLKNLKQAHDAFVYGATYGALALMRSIMEAVLRDHYGAQGKDLSERIHSVRGHLPDNASDAALHRLRKLANAILHLDPEKDEGLPSMDDERLEKEIVTLLFVLRALIEGAK